MSMATFNDDLGDYGTYGFMYYYRCDKCGHKYEAAHQRNPHNVKCEECGTRNDYDYSNYEWIG